MYWAPGIYSCFERGSTLHRMKGGEELLEYQLNPFEIRLILIKLQQGLHIFQKFTEPHSKLVLIYLSNGTSAR